MTLPNDWCDYTENLGETKPARKVRCPKCRRRLRPRVLDSEPFGMHFQAYYVLPPHKVPHGKRHDAAGRGLKTRIPRGGE